MDLFLLFQSSQANATMDDARLRASASTIDAWDENSASSSSFSNVTQAFSQRISELQQLVCFRVEDSVKHIFVRDIQGIEASVRALEQLFDELRQRTQQEMSVLPKARALLQAAQLQQQHLQQISSNLPQHLPGSNRAAAGGVAAGAGQQAPCAVQGVRGPAAAAAGGAAAAAAAAAKDDGRGAAGSKAGDRRRRDTSAAGAAGGGAAAAGAAAAAPRWFITAAELASTPGYMRGRLTLEKVNAALDELAAYAESCRLQMNAVGRNQLSRVASSAEDRQRLHDMYHSIEMKEVARGRFWFMETDLKAGSAVRMDKTGKSMLMLLRHLGRLQEVRAAVESLGGSVTAYVLQQA